MEGWRRRSGVEAPHHGSDGALPSTFRTPQVVAWLNGSVAEFGFGLSADATASALLGAKEGSGSGYPAVLEVDIDRGIGDGSVGSVQLAAGAAVANLADGSLPVAKLASSSLTVTAGTGLTGGGAVSLGGGDHAFSRDESHPRRHDYGHFQGRWQRADQS